MKLNQGRYRTDCNMPLDISIYSQVYKYKDISIYNPKSSSDIYGAGPSISLAIISMVTMFWLSKMSLRALLGKCDSKTSTANRELWADLKKEVPLSKSLIPWGCIPYILHLMRWGKPAFIFSWKSRRLAASNLFPNINHPSGPIVRIKFGIF